MYKTLSCLLLAICSLATFAQENNFYISNTFFKGQKVLMFSESRGGAVVVLEGNTIYIMNRNQEFSEVTALFSDEIRNNINCIQAINENIFLIGTLNNSLIKYSEGIVTNLKDLNPALPSKINSIDFDGTSLNAHYMVATSNGLWGSNDLETFNNLDWSYTKDAKMFGGRQSILLTEYPYCTEVPGQFGLEYSYFGNATLFRLFENEGFEIQNLNDVTYAKRGFGSGTYNTYAYYATENGIYAQHINSCSKDTTSHFKNTSVYDLEIISSGLTKSTIMAASDSGLLYTESSNGTYFNVYDPQYFILDGIDSAFSVNYSVYHNVIWVGTNTGLLQVFDEQLSQQSLEPDTSNFKTANLCAEEEGMLLSIEMNDQLDRQWYYNGEKIEGAVANHYYAKEPGLYSIKYVYQNQEFEFDIAYILEPPFLSADQLTKYICEPEANVYFDIPFGSTSFWQGYSKGENIAIGPGTYSVTISNGVCQAFNTKVEIIYFNPFPQLDQTIYALSVNDTLKIPTDPSDSIFWDWPIQKSKDQSFLYITSSVSDTLIAELQIQSPNCTKKYLFGVYFTDPLSVNNITSSINIYPNPSSNGVWINTALPNIKSIQLVSLNGSIITSRRVENNNTNFFEFPPNLSNGVYLIQINTSNNDIIRRIIVNKE